MKKTFELHENTPDTADHCIACTCCIANCPVTEATRAFAGPKLTGPAHSRMKFAEDDIERSLEYCSNCKNCEITCPSGVRVATLNMLQRGEYYRTHKHSQRDDMLAHGERMAKLVRSLPFGATCANIGMKIGKALGVFAAVGIAGERDMPAFAPDSFYSIFAKMEQKPSEKKVVFYPGCYINEYEPEIGRAFINVMQKNGYEVITDKSFICCGAPMVASGYLDEAHENAKKNAERILAWKAKGIPVVACCTSCSLMLKSEYHELFEDPEMREISSGIYDAFEFLDIMEERGELSEDFAPIERRFSYHAPCHLRAQGIGLPSFNFLQRIPGLSIENLAAGCCGMSGSFGFKGDKYEISMKVGEKVFERIAEVGADTVVSDCGTCRLQIRHGSGKATCHPIEILAQAYGYK
ncbi:anaerobic glycerol-3-phosphate dehydrogenase subunit C [uncultured Selenomonas sp.]|uniref:anaerobic glycerol-3-phosphate dehydrogenase subunit C n=1 Tax=uncultured Selenomonas sp. TaxID=159275 RepID=UPI0028D02CCA|nr:anaerobic glycerol-3-phosphate dehydrogenase subunit C [uncultured Selenomonas sp.]